MRKRPPGSRMVRVPITGQSNMARERADDRVARRRPAEEGDDLAVGDALVDDDADMLAVPERRRRSPVAAPRSETTSPLVKAARRRSISSAT